MVDIVRSYSKRPDLLEDLDRAVRRLAQAAKTHASDQPLSVRSSGRVGRVWALAERLTEAEVRALAANFRAGTRKWRLVAQYGISESSVKRILRLHRETTT
jgi:hypothetical protein